MCSGCVLWHGMCGMSQCAKRIFGNRRRHVGRWRKMHERRVCRATSVHAQQLNTRCWHGMCGCSMCGMCQWYFWQPQTLDDGERCAAYVTYTVTPSHVDCFVDVARGMRACAASLAAFLSARSSASLVARTPMAQDMMTAKAIPMTTKITRGCVVMVTTTAVCIESHNSTPSPRRALRYAAMCTLLDLLPAFAATQSTTTVVVLSRACTHRMQSRSFFLSKFVLTEHPPTASHAHRGRQQVLKADPLARMAKDRGAHQPSADEVRRL